MKSTVKFFICGAKIPATRCASRAREVTAAQLRDNCPVATLGGLGRGDMRAGLTVAEIRL